MLLGIRNLLRVGNKHRRASALAASVSARARQAESFIHPPGITEIPSHPWFYEQLLQSVQTMSSTSLCMQNASTHTHTRCSSETSPSKNTLATLPTDLCAAAQTSWLEWLPEELQQKVAELVARVPGPPVRVCTGVDPNLATMSSRDYEEGRNDAEYVTAYVGGLFGTPSGPEVDPPPPELWASMRREVDRQQTVEFGGDLRTPARVSAQSGRY